MTTFAVMDGAWSNPATWDNGVPDASQRAVIGGDFTVELDGPIDHQAKELVIQGELVVTEEAGVDKSLTSEWVHVNSGGAFIVGTATDRYDEADFNLKLTGTDLTADHTIEGVPMTVMNNNGFLMTAGTGSLQFYGEEKLSFTKLAATADAPDNSITVHNFIERNFSEGQSLGGDFVTSPADDGVLNWSEGDLIVIASSSYDYKQEEVRLITDVNDNGDGTTTLSFEDSLEYRHYGVQETYGQSNAPGTVPASQTYEIDMRAEVSLLSRNIRIQGDLDQDTDNNFGDRQRMQTEPRVRSAALTPTEAVPSEQVANGIGGHLMFMQNSGQITIDGVQLDGMGQASQKGRYPIHWHNGDERSGDVLRNSSITNSNNRGVTIHGTKGLLIEGVVLHDIHGHGFFFEDAIETDNTLISNIALGIHAVGGNDSDAANPGGRDPFVVDTHDSAVEARSRFSSSAAYWITNPDNTFVGNIAAGAGDQRTDDWAGDPGPAGTGFWFAIPRAALGDAMNSGVQPIFAEFGQFDYNSSHSTSVGLNFDRGSDLEDAAAPGDLNSIHGANEYSPRAGGVSGGAPQSYFIEGFTGYKAYGAAVYHRGEANSIKFRDLKIADSYNGPWAVSENEYHNSLFVGHSKGNANLDAIVGGPRLYDGAGLYAGSHFAGFGEDNAFAFQVEGSSFGPTMYHAFQDTSFEDAQSHGSIAHAVSDFTRGPKGEYRENHDLGRPAQWTKAAMDFDGSLTGGFGGGVGYSIVPDVDFLVDDEDVPLPGGGAWLTDDIYARIRVQNKDDGQDRFGGDFKDSLNETLLRFTNQDGKVIEAIEGQNNGNLSWIQIAAKADEDGPVEGTFSIEYGREGLPKNGFVLNVKNQDGNRPQEQNADIQARIDSARVVIRIVGASNYTPNNASEVLTDAALRSASTGVTYFRDDAAGDLYLNVGIADSQDFIEFAPGDSLQSIDPSRPTASRTIEYGTVIEAEQFDVGIDGTAYHDSDAVNSLGSFRGDTGVDATSTGIGDIADGEWLEYTTNVAGNAYNVGVNIASTTNSGKVRFLSGLSDSAGALRDFGTVDIVNTGGAFQTVWFKSPIDLTYLDGVSDAVVRLEFEGGGFEVDSFEFAPATQTSFEPGRTIEAGFAETTIRLEEFDHGGQGAAYFDDTAEIIDRQNDLFTIRGNDASREFRTDEDVDANRDGLQGKVFDGEWLEYTTNIQAGTYDITLHKFWGGSDNGVKLFVGESNSALEFDFIDEFDFVTGENNEFITLEGIDLSDYAGADRVIRIEIVGNWMGLNEIEFVSTSAATDGDFNGDGLLNCADINALTADIADDNNTATFDLNGDALVNGADLIQWLAIAATANGLGATYLPADFNLDGSVDASDFNIWNSNKFTTTSAWCSGDGNANGVVDASDFNIWNSNKFTSSDLLQSVVASPEDRKDTEVIIAPLDAGKMDDIAEVPVRKLDGVKAQESLQRDGAQSHRVRDLVFSAQLDDEDNIESLNGFML